MNNENCESGKCLLPQEKIDFITSRQICSDKIGIKSEKLSDIRIKIFGKNDCDICKKAIEKLHQYLTKIENKPTVIYYDLNTLDGLTEAAIYIAFDIPTIVLEKNGCEIKRWKNLLSLEELKNIIGDR
ncbi:MAG: hypothetical protein COS68_05540 [Elusimicrobia bacterium CG06_land_8_20_14_3_00_38_11]|nr:MAG: hypothetical protein COS68_05540 [Elusimicrobia bacterium CG06_land_8_20_14_3_00_38_11]